MNQRNTLATNESDLVAISVAGAVAHPGFPGLPSEPYRLTADGTPLLAPDVWGNRLQCVRRGPGLRLGRGLHPPRSEHRPGRRQLEPRAERLRLRGQPGPCDDR